MRLFSPWHFINVFTFRKLVAGVEFITGRFGCAFNDGAKLALGAANICREFAGRVVIAAQEWPL